LNTLRTAALLIATLIGLAVPGGQPVLAKTPAKTLAKPDVRPNWAATVAVQADGTHVLGNPDAKVKIDEFISYTCPHCASFQREAEAPVRIAYIMPGKVAMRVVHVVRDPVDLAVAMLTNCGDPNGFFARHNAFLASQRVWLARANATTEAQRARWIGGAVPTRMRAIASDLDFYTIMSRRGTSRAQTDRCLADVEVARRVAAQRGEAERIGLAGTPGFAIGGVLLEEVSDWSALKAAIDARL
jgi:protein-disulfide isomerase